MKIFKLTNAELKKIFLKPVMLLMFFSLVISVSLLTMTFQPQKRIETNVNVNKTAQVLTIYNDFLKDSNENSKKNFDDIIIKTTDQITTFFQDFKDDEEGNIEQLKFKISEEKNIIESIYSSIVNYTQVKNDSNTTGLQVAQARNNIVSKFSEVASKAQEIRLYFQDIKENNLNFFITEEQAETIETFFKNLQFSVPSNFPVRDRDEFIFETNYNFLRDNFDFNVLTNITNDLKYFNITQDKFQPILQKYSYDVLNANNLQDTTPTLNKLFSEMKVFYQENAESKENEHLDQMQKYISQYKSIAIMNSTVLENQFLMIKVGSIKDSDVRNYIGFSQYSQYQLKQSSNLNKYLLENNLFDYDYLNTFSFNQNSGQSTNAFDFVVYAMQIISLIIAIFSIFIASGTIANEQNTGTMKMIAIRPYSRTKIITAKLLSVFSFMFIILTLSFASTLAVGYISYGIEQTQSLIIFNAENVMLLNSFLVLGIYFVSLFLKMAFFITIALLFSVMFKSNTVAIMLSLLLYGFTLIGNGLLVNSSWFSALPLAHLDIFRYFGTQASIGNFFGFSFPLNTSFDSTITYLAISISLAYLISVRIFKTRNIA